LVNSGIADYRQYIDGFSKGEQYVFRIKYGVADTSTSHGATTLKGSKVPLDFSICEYTLVDGKYRAVDGQIYFTGRIEPTVR
jgi:hypothetical protein